MSAQHGFPEIAVFLSVLSIDQKRRGLNEVLCFHVCGMQLFQDIGPYGFRLILERILKLAVYRERSLPADVEAPRVVFDFQYLGHRRPRALRHFRN